MDVIPQVTKTFCWRTTLDSRENWRQCDHTVPKVSCWCHTTLTTTTVQVMAMMQNIPIAKAMSSCLSWDSLSNIVLWKYFFEKFMKMLWVVTWHNLDKRALSKTYFCCFSFSAFFSSSISLIVFPLASSSSSFSCEKSVFFFTLRHLILSLKCSLQGIFQRIRVSRDLPIN